MKKEQTNQKRNSIEISPCDRPRTPLTEMCENALKHELVRFVGKAPRKDVNFNLYQSFTQKRRISTVRFNELSSEQFLFAKLWHT